MKGKRFLLLPALAFCASTLVAQPDVMLVNAEGCLERAKQAYQLHNYVGALDQVAHLKTLPHNAAQREEADYWAALSLFERGKSESLTALHQFLEKYPSSLRYDDVQMRIGNYYFYHGEWDNAMLSYSLVRNNALDADAQEDLLYRQTYCRLRLGEYDAARAGFATLSSSKRYGAATQFYDAYVDYANGDYTTARRKFEAIDPNSELGYQSQYYLTQLDYQQKNYNRVIDRGTQLLAEGRNDYFDAELNRVVGESYYHTGDDRQARVYLRRYLDNPEGEPYRTAAYTMGTLDYRDGNYDATIADMSLVTGEQDALTQSAYVYLGQARLKQNDLDGASRAFEQAANMPAYDKQAKETAFYNYAVTQSKGAKTPFNRSIDLFEQFLNDYPNSRYKDDVEGHLVDTYLNTTDYERALQSINNIKKPGKKVLSAKQHVLYKLGVQAMSNGQNKAATGYFQQAIDIGNYNKTARDESRLWLAEAQYRSGNYKAAAENQKAYVKSTGKNDENYAIAQYNLGYSLFQQRKYADARTAFQNAVNAKGLSSDLRADAYNRIGDTNYYTKNYSAAQQSYDRALTEDKNVSGDYAMYQKGMMMGLNKQYSDEITQMDALLKAYPNTELAPQALLEKGNAQAALGQTTSAIGTYAALAKSYPKSAEARKGLLQTALTQKAGGDETAAIDSYKKIIRSYPTSDEAKAAAEDLKVIYADRGELGQYEKFLSSVPNAPKMDVNEVDRLTFESAEKAAIADKPSIDKMQQYLKNYPNGAYADKAKYYIGRYNYEKGKYDDALTNINASLKGGSDASYAEDAIAIRSDILAKQGKYDEAMKSYEELAERSSSDDNRTTAQLGAMRVAQKAKNYKQVGTLANALLSRGGLTAAEEQETTLARALAAKATGDTKQAQQDFTTLSADPQSEAGAQAAYELAQMQYEQGDLKSAEKTVNALVNAGTPHNYWLAKSFITLSDVYHKQGKTADARDYLQSLRNNYPGKDKEIFNEIDKRLKAWKSGKK